MGAPNEDDIGMVMRTLELEEDVTCFDMQDGSRNYRLRHPQTAGLPFDVFAGRTPSFMEVDDERRQAPDLGRLQIPCWSCPVKDQCHPTGRINPQSCEYMTRWLHSPNSVKCRMATDW